MKTNAMRILDKSNIQYSIKEYPVDENDLSGVHVAKVLGMDERMLFKTLLLKGEKRGYLVCCIPVAEELDMKKAAKAAGDKSVAMLPLKDLTAVSGYLRGGCSPIGMKRQYPTFIESTATAYDNIAISGDKRGVQIIIAPNSLSEFIGAEFCDLVQDNSSQEYK